MTYAPQEKKGDSAAKKPPKKQGDDECAAFSKIRYSDATAFLAARDPSSARFGIELVQGHLQARVITAEDVLQIAEMLVMLKRYAGEDVSEVDLFLRLIDASMKSRVVDVTDELPAELRSALGDLGSYYKEYRDHVDKEGFPTCDSQTGWNAEFTGNLKPGPSELARANCHWMVNLILSGKRPAHSDEGEMVDSSVQGRGPHDIVSREKVRVGDVAAFVSGVPVRPDSGGDMIGVGGVIHAALVIRVSGADAAGIQVLEKVNPRRPIGTRTVAEILAHYTMQRATVIFLRPRPRSGSQSP